MQSNSALALEEMKAFLEMVPALYRDPYLVWFRAGWRPSEILAARFDWLDIPRQTMTLRPRAHRPLGRQSWGAVVAGVLVAAVGLVVACRYPAAWSLARYWRAASAGAPSALER